MVEAVSARSTGTEPMTMPSTTPAASAMARPIAQVRTVSPRAAQKPPWPAWSPRATRIRLVGGK